MNRFYVLALLSRKHFPNSAFLVPVDCIIKLYVHRQSRELHLSDVLDMNCTVEDMPKTFDIYYEFVGQC